MPYHKKNRKESTCIGDWQQNSILNELSALIMAECGIKEVDGKFNYFENLDVARKAKLITQFIIYHIELQTGINFNLIQGGNNDIDHTDEENNLYSSLNNKKMYQKTQMQVTTMLIQIIMWQEQRTI